MRISDSTLIKVAKKYQTPLYVYDFDGIKKNYQEFKQAFYGRKSIIAYAIKANSNFALMQMLAKEGCGADCVSINEVKLALKAGVKKYNIVFSGVAKSYEEIKQALELDILLINVESAFELEDIIKIAKEQNKKARISIRLNPDIEPKTHPYISTGLSENKFGVNAKEARAMYVKAKKSEYLEPIGLHTHIGSQLTDIKPIQDSLKIASDFARELIALGIDLRFFNVGGGLGITYDDEKTIPLYDYAQSIFKALGDKDLTIICEPGRSIVGNNGVLLNSVVGEKLNHDKRFVIVDGAMNDLLRIPFYNAYHKIALLNDSDDNKMSFENDYKNAKGDKCNVVGPVCESGDFFAKGINLPQTKKGDIICVYSAGAYGFCMASNYNQRVKPAEVALYTDENNKLQDKLVRGRESFDDLLKNQII